MFGVFLLLVEQLAGGIDDGGRGQPRDQDDFMLHPADAVILEGADPRPGRPGQLLGRDGDAGLFTKFPNRRVDDRLARVDPAAGQLPPGADVRTVRVDGPEQQHPTVRVEHHDAYAVALFDRPAVIRQAGNRGHLVGRALVRWMTACPSAVPAPTCPASAVRTCQENDSRPGSTWPLRVGTETSIRRVSLVTPKRQVTSAPAAAIGSRIAQASSTAIRRSSISSRPSCKRAASPAVAVRKTAR